MISLPTRGALSVLSIEVERELTEADLLELRFMPDNSPPTLKTISARHRRTAMMVAQGRSNEEIAEALGYTPTRVSQLRFDPSFAELVAGYEDQIHEESLADEKRYRAKLLMAGETALDSMMEQLEENPRAIPFSERRQVVTMAADRTVAPPRGSTNMPPPPTEITLNFGDALKPKSGKIINQEGEKIGDSDLESDIEWELRNRSEGGGATQ